MVEEEEDGYDETRDDGGEDPRHRQLPKFHQEHIAVRVGRPKRGAYAQGGFVKIGELADMRQANEDDDANGGGVLG